MRNTLSQIIVIWTESISNFKFCTFIVSLRMNTLACVKFKFALKSFVLVLCCVSKKHMKTF